IIPATSPWIVDALCRARAAAASTCPLSTSNLVITRSLLTAPRWRADGPRLGTRQGRRRTEQGAGGVDVLDPGRGSTSVAPRPGGALRRRGEGGGGDGGGGDRQPVASTACPRAGGAPRWRRARARPRRQPRRRGLSAGSLPTPDSDPSGARTGSPSAGSSPT